MRARDVKRLREPARAGVIGVSRAERRRAQKVQKDQISAGAVHEGAHFGKFVIKPEARRRERFDVAAQKRIERRRVAGDLPPRRPERLNEFERAEPRGEALAV